MRWTLWRPLGGMATLIGRCNPSPDQGMCGVELVEYLAPQRIHEHTERKTTVTYAQNWERITTAMSLADIETGRYGSPEEPVGGAIGRRSAKNSPIASAAHLNGVGRISAEFRREEAHLVACS